MKKHYALIDDNDVIQDTLEINDVEIKYEPPPGLRWVELTNVDKTFHKEPEKYSVNKEKAHKKEEIILNVSATKVFVGDTITINIDIPGENKSSTLVINDQKTQINDGDSIDLQVANEGIYKIYCEDKKFYCSVIYIEAHIP